MNGGWGECHFRPLAARQARQSRKIDACGARESAQRWRKWRETSVKNLQSVYRNNKKRQKPYFITLFLFRNQVVLIRLFVSAVNNVLVRLRHNEF